MGTLSCTKQIHHCWKHFDCYISLNILKSTNIIWNLSIGSLILSKNCINLWKRFSPQKVFEIKWWIIQKNWKISHNQMLRIRITMSSLNMSFWERISLVFLLILMFSCFKNLDVVYLFQHYDQNHGNGHSGRQSEKNGITTMWWWYQSRGEYGGENCFIFILPECFLYAWYIS